MLVKVVVHLSLITVHTAFDRKRTTACERKSSCGRLADSAFGNTDRGWMTEGSAVSSSQNLVTSCL